MRVAPGAVRMEGLGGASGDDPDDVDEGEDGESEAGIEKCQGDSDEVDGKAGEVLSLLGGTFFLEPALIAKMAVDGTAQQKEAGGGDQEGDGVEDDGEGIEVFLKHPGGEEGEEREAEEEREVGVEDARVSLFDAADEMVVVDPVDGGEGEGEEIDKEGGKDGAQASEAVSVGDFELEHHDGDDDGDDAVGEGFETRGGGGGGHVGAGDLVCRIHGRCGATVFAGGKAVVWSRMIFQPSGVFSKTREKIPSALPPPSGER